MIKTPGSTWRTSRVSHDNEIAVEDVVFLASLIALKSSDIDIILGMDWLSKHRAKIDCATKSIQLTHPSGKIVHFTSQGSEIQLYSLNEHPLPNLEGIPIVCDFPDVLPKELPGMPSDRCVEFIVDLATGTAPISRRPYRIAPHDL